MNERIQTHSEECWRWRGHEKCAERKVEQLLSENEKLRDAYNATVKTNETVERLTTEGTTKDDLLRQWLHVEGLSDQELHTLRCETIEAVSSKQESDDGK